MEFTLLAAVLTGVAFAWITLRLHADRVNRIDRPLDALIGAAAVGMVVGRLVAMAGARVNPLTHPTDILIVRAGVDTVAASAAATATLIWMGRKDLPGFVDSLAPAALAGLAGWHAGCLWRGTCLGAAAAVPWGWAQPGSTITRHPIGLYGAVALVLAAWLVTRVRTPWVPTGLAIGSASLVRLLIEPVRPSLTGGPMWWYGLAVLAGAGVAVFGWRRTPPQRPLEPHGNRPA